LAPREPSGPAANFTKEHTMTNSLTKVYAELAVAHELEDPDFAWQVKADCADEVANGVDLWGSVDKNEKRRARAICSECPVINDCLQFALTNDIGYGIWGGQTPTGRKRIAAARAKEVSA
jgi:WhiB family redox-sensing transcriptional regulator